MQHQYWSCVRVSNSLQDLKYIGDLGQDEALRGFQNLISSPGPAKDPELPGCAQVLLTLRAIGLNFRDVLNVLGMYPGRDPGEPGGDVAGIIAAVGVNFRTAHQYVPLADYPVHKCSVGGQSCPSPGMYLNA